MKKIPLLLSIPFVICSSLTAQNAWTLQDCINHALQHNIQIKKNKITEEQGEVSLWQYRGALLPSLSISTNQSVGYRPFEENTAIVQNGQVTNTSNKTTYQGSYGMSAQWSVWNGGINQKNIKEQKIQNEISKLNTELSELTIQEQIAQLYVQILYTKEAIRVNEKLQETAQKQYERGLEWKTQGLLAIADLAQLEAQLSSAKYDVVSAQSQLANYKRQLKAILELGLDTHFDVSDTMPDDETTLSVIPSAHETYQMALSTRPEIKSAELNIEASDIELDIAKRGFLPTISMNASIGDSHYSASQKSTRKQMKNNLNANAGISLSVPVFDNRRNRSNVKQAKLKMASSRLDLQDKKQSLSSTIEQYWINAQTQQQNYLAAKTRVKSQEASYELLNEQFNNGLKYVVDVLQGRDNLINAEQAMLQSKYTALLNIQMLKFYSGEPLDL